MQGLMLTDVVAKFAECPKTESGFTGRFSFLSGCNHESSSGDPVSN